MIVRTRSNESLIRLASWSGIRGWLMSESSLAKVSLCTAAAEAPGGLRRRRAKYSVRRTSTHDSTNVARDWALHPPPPPPPPEQEQEPGQ